MRDRPPYTDSFGRSSPARARVAYRAPTLMPMIEPKPKNVRIADRPKLVSMSYTFSKKNEMNDVMGTTAAPRKKAAHHVRFSVGMALSRRQPSLSGILCALASAASARSMSI